MSCVDFVAVEDYSLEVSTWWKGRGCRWASLSPLYVPGDASSVFRWDTEAFSGAPCGATGAPSVSTDLHVLLP